MGIGIFGSGVSALNAAQIGLSTTEHNIANANTPGFNRQEVVLATRLPQATGAGFIGQGVDVATVKRIYNEFLSNQVCKDRRRQVNWKPITSRLDRSIICWLIPMLVSRLHYRSFSAR